MFRTITARFPGTCRRCHGPIAIGDQIRHGGRGMTYHMAAACSAGATPAHAPRSRWSRPDDDELGSAIDPADESERRYFRNFDADYQLETQGFVSSP